MELRLNREKITGQKQTTTGTATKRKLILGTPSAAQGVGGNQKPDTAPAVSDLETATISAGRANFSGDRGGTAMGKGFGTTPSLAQRVGDTLSGAGKQYAASIGGALTGLYSMGTATREKENQQEQAEIQRRLKLMDEGWKQQLAAGKVTARDKAEYEQAVKAQQDRLNVLKEVQRAQRGTTGASLGAMEELEQSAQRDVDRAKEGLGGVGRFVVDTGVAGSQMLMDATLGGGSAMLPMAGRVFGGGYQEATREGATNGEALAYGAGSAAVSVLTEKLANVAAPFKKIYGGGWLDEAIGKTAGKMNTTAAGRLALSALSEAGEEFLEAAAQPVLQRATYDKNARFDLGEALYSALVGAALGGAGGAVEVIGGRGTPSVTADGGDSSPTRGELSAPEAQQDTASGDEVQNGQDVQARPQTTAQPAQGAAEPENLTFQQEVARQLQGQEQPKTAQTGAENIQTIGGMTDETAENGRLDAQKPGGSQAGTGISGGDVQRADGARAGGEDGVLAESTERTRERAAEQQRAAGERQNYAKALRLNPVSSKELGLASGTDARVTRVLPAEHWDDAMRQTAQRVKQETGKDVTYVVGAIQVRDQSGNVHRVRGVFSDTGIILQCDNLRYTIDQIADHETYHDKAARSPELNQRIRERITQKFNADEFSAILDKYIRGQRGLLDLSEDASEAEMKAFEDAVMEEIFADAYAGMNAFGSHAEKFQGTVEQVMTEQGVGRSRETARASDRTTGPPKRFSYAGKNALRANEAAREEAERLEMQGVDSETIRRQTGWFRGTDRQWRWEIDSKDYIPGDISQEETLEGIRAVAGMEPVTAIAGTEFQKGEKDLTTQAAEFFDSIGNQVFNPQLGDVTLDRRGAKDDIAHGIGRKKAAAFAAVPDVLEKGRVIDFQKDWKGRGYDTAVVAAPITIGGVKHYAGVVLLCSRDTNRFYVHEVLTTENGASPFKTGASPKRGLPGGDAPSIISLLRQVRDVNTEDTGAPEGLRLPRPEPMPGSKKQYSVSQPEGLTLPGAESENKPASAVEALPDKAQNYLKGPEWISLPKLEKFSMEDEGEQITIQKWTRERAIEEELARRGAEDYQQLLLRKGGVKALNENDRAMKKLQKQLDKLNGKRPKKMTRPSNKPPQKSLPTIAKQDLKQNLLNLFSIPEGQRTELGAVIDHYAEQMLKEGSLTQQTRDRFFDRMYAAGVVTVQADPYYQAGRGAVAGGRVYVNKQIRGDFGEDWNDFRKRAFAAGVYLTSDKTHAGVDVWNQELSEILPGMFDTDELDGRTVLERIVQAAEEGKDEKMSLADYAAMLDRQGKYEKMSLADHTAMLAQQERVTADQLLDGIERQMDWALRTFAEKAKLEIRLRDRTGIKLAQMRADHKEAAERQRADRELRELQQKTLKQLQWLSKNRNRAPAEVKAAWDEVLGDIDLFAVGAANEMNWSEKYNATWRDLAQMYKDAQENDPNFLPSEELKRIVSRLDNKKIGDMDVDALQVLYRAAICLRQEFYNRNNVLGDMEHRMFEEVFDDAKKELEGQSGRYSGKAWDRLFNLEQLTPLNVMQRMAGWNPKSTWFSMAKQIEKGERDVRGYTVEANRYLEQFLAEHEEWIKKADGQGEDAIWYELEVPELVELRMGDKPIFGQTFKVYMTPAQKIHLYLESKSEDNLRHMAGGRTFVDRELYSRGKRQEAMAQGRTIKLAPETVKKIVSDLTAEERELARLLENYYNDFAKQRINRVSNVLYGYDKAIGKNYAPIYANSNYTKSEIGIYDATAEGAGNLKARQYSKNPSYNLSCFDAFERHVDQTARFVGMSIPARNWQTLLNWRVKNNSMSDILTHKWGEESKKYITDLLEDLQGGKVLERDTISSTIDKTFSKYISAVFGANPSIVLKQLGSIPLASAYLDMKNVPSMAQLRSIDRGLIGKYTQELDYRTMGYSMPETKILKENPGRMQSNKFLNFTFGGGAITAMDGWAASTLWPWAENKVRRDFPELEVGTQEQIETGKSPFYQKVAELFNEAVTHTQSVSDITHQSTLRKSRNPITRAFTMFKSDSAQGYNVLRQKIGEAQYYKKSGADAETVRKAQRDAGGAFLSIVAGYSYAQVITFLINLWKQKGKKYKDDEGELSAGSVLQEMAFGVVGDVAGMVVLGQELAEIIGNILTGETWYGIDTPGNEQLNDLLETVIDSFKGVGEFVSDMASIVSKGGSPVEYIRRHGNDYLGGIKDAAAAAATYLPGLPVNNLEAYLLGLVRWMSPELATAYDDLMATATKSGLSGLKGDALTIRVRNLLENRAGDVSAETAKTLAALYEAGYKQAAPTDTPGSITVGEEDNKQTLKLDAYQQQLYDMVWQAAIGGALDELAASDAFLDADAETQADMAEKLYEYAQEKGRAAVTDEYEMSSTAQKADEIIGAGATAAQWAALAATMSGAKSAEKYRLIADSDLSEEAMVAAIGTVMGTEMKTDSGSPSQYAKMLDAHESGIGVDEYLDLHEAGVVDQYLENVEAGVNPDTAAEIVLRIADIKGAAKAAEEDLSDLELYRAAVDVTDGESEQLAALQSLMTDSEYAKLTVGHDAGVTPEQYVQVRETIAEIDDNGNTSQAEATQAIARMSGLTVNQKAALWQIQNKSWSAKNNPFSPGVGAKVKRAMEEDAASDAPAWISLPKPGE